LLTDAYACGQQRIEFDEVVDASIDYGLSEECIGRYLSRRRSEYFLASKTGWRRPRRPRHHRHDARRPLLDGYLTVQMELDASLGVAAIVPILAIHPITAG
jgi:hypothetical protein